MHDVHHMAQVPQDSILYVFMKSLSSTAVGSGPLRAERRRREVRREIFTTPKLVTARRSILGPPADGRPGPSDNDDDRSSSKS